MFGARRTSSAGGVRGGGIGGGSSFGRKGNRAAGLGARGQLRNVMAKVLESNDYYGGVCRAPTSSPMRLSQSLTATGASHTPAAAATPQRSSPFAAASANKLANAPASAKTQSPLGTRGSSVFTSLALRRRFAVRQRSATSVVVTVTFVAIFTCIVAMEVLFIDEDKRLKLWSKVPEMQDGEAADSNGGGGGGGSGDLRRQMPPVLQLPVEVQNLLMNSNAGMMGAGFEAGGGAGGGGSVARRHYYDIGANSDDIKGAKPEVGAIAPDKVPGIELREVAGGAAAGGRALHQEDRAPLVVVGPVATSIRRQPAAEAGDNEVARAVAAEQRDPDNNSNGNNSSGSATTGGGVNYKAGVTVASGVTATRPHGWLAANRTFEVGDWQPVLGARDKFYVYAAYLDVRQGRFVRVIGAARTRNYEKVVCVYWYGADPLVTPPITVQASTKVIRENWNLKFSAMFVLCPLFLYNLGRTVPVPDEVSVVVGSDFSSLGNRLPVQNRNTSSATANTASGFGDEGGFAVCVKPLHYNFNRAAQLIEFVELNRILGVKHFIFYNHTIGREVDCLLRQYEAEGLVTLLPWQLDMISQKEIRTEGLFAAINDCLYRHMYRYRYLLMIDIDEYIIPHRNGSLVGMLREFNRKVDPLKAGSFSFMNSFFYLQWPNDPSSRDLSVPLITLQKTKRRSKFHPHKQRSKCIVIPRFVVEMGNHFVWEFLPGKGAVNVAPEIAFLHHYRVCEFGGNDCVKTQSVTDRTVYRYKGQLVHRFQQRIERTLNASGRADPRCHNLSFNLTVSAV